MGVQPASTMSNWSERPSTSTCSSAFARLFQGSTTALRVSETQCSRSALRLASSRPRRKSHRPSDARDSLPEDPYPPPHPASPSSSPGTRAPLAVSPLRPPQSWHPSGKPEPGRQVACRISAGRYRTGREPGGTGTSSIGLASEFGGVNTTVARMTADLNDAQYNLKLLTTISQRHSAQVFTVEMQEIKSH